MRITQTELRAKYGINLPKGTYSIKTEDKQYIVNTVKDDTDGCILVGKNTKKGMVTESKKTFLDLYSKMVSAYKKGQSITITIK